MYEDAYNMSTKTLRDHIKVQIKLYVRKNNILPEKSFAFDVFS